MYDLKIYLKYLKHCVRKKPLYGNSYFYHNIDNLSDILKFRNKFYQVTFQNGKKGVACIKKYSKLSSTGTYKLVRYDQIIVWNIVGYENQKLIRDCSFKEFKQIYASLFYPHLATEEDIFGTYVADKLSPTVDNAPQALIIMKI